MGGVGSLWSDLRESSSLLRSLRSEGGVTIITGDSTSGAISTLVQIDGDVVTRVSGHPGVSPDVVSQHLAAIDGNLLLSGRLTGLLRAAVGAVASLVGLALAWSATGLGGLAALAAAVIAVATMFARYASRLSSVWLRAVRVAGAVMSVALVVATAGWWAVIAIAVGFVAVVAVLGLLRLWMARRVWGRMPGGATPDL